MFHHIQHNLKPIFNIINKTTCLKAFKYINKTYVSVVYITIITYVSIMICIANRSYRIKHDALPGPRLSLQLQI